MSTIQIPFQTFKDMLERLSRAEMAVEILSIYVSTEEYPHEKFIEKICNHVMVSMPFSTPEPPEKEAGWHE